MFLGTASILLFRYFVNDRLTDDSIMPIADHTVCNSTGYDRLKIKTKTIQTLMQESEQQQQQQPYSVANAAALAYLSFARFVAEIMTITMTNLSLQTIC